MPDVEYRRGIHFDSCALHRADVDEQGIPIGELLESLEGWRDFLELSSTLHIRGALSPQPLPPEQRVRINVKRIGPGGSVVAQILLRGGMTIASVELKEAWLQGRRKIWALAVKMYKEHMEAKRKGASIHEAATAIKPALSVLRSLRIPATASDLSLTTEPKRGSSASY